VSLRVLALVGGVLALVVWLAAVRPVAQETALAQREFGRTRVERERLRQRMASVERRVAAQKQLVAASSAVPGDPVKALRMVTVEAVSGMPLSDVRLEVSPGRAPTPAQVRLSAVGSFREILRLGERLVGPRSGIALERVQLTSVGGSAVRAEFEGFTLGAASP
jgi:hypothetical protein